MLRPDGRALLQSPVDNSRAETFEDPSVTSPAERLRVFGQEDHARSFGRDYAQWLSVAGIEVEVLPYAHELYEERRVHHGLDPDEDVYFSRRRKRG